MGLKPAQSTFIRFKDLEGRLVIVQVHEIGRDKSTVAGAPPDATYEWARVTCAVLDGRPGKAGRNLAEIEEEAPFVLEDARFAGQSLMPQLKSLCGKYDEDGTPKLAYGRVEPQVSRAGTDTYKMVEPTDEDTRMAQEYVRRNPDVFPPKATGLQPAGGLRAEPQQAQQQRVRDAFA